MKDDRRMGQRRMATPLYSRKAQNDWMSLMGVSFIVGAMLGAVFTLAILGV